QKDITGSGGFLAHRTGWGNPVPKWSFLFGRGLRQLAMADSAGTYGQYGILPLAVRSDSVGCRSLSILGAAATGICSPFTPDWADSHLYPTGFFYPSGHPLPLSFGTGS